MSRSGRVDVAVKLEESGVEVVVVDVWPWGEMPDAQLGRNFLFGQINLWDGEGRHG